MQAQDPFLQLLATLPAAAYTCDADGLITYFNDHAVGVWGRAPRLNDPVDRFCGSFKLFSAVDGSPISHDRCWMALALQEQKEYNGHEIIIEQPGGKRRTAIAHANPIRNDGGTMIGAVNVLVDITERKESEQKIRDMNQTLESLVAVRTAELLRSNEVLAERNRELEQFASVTSHDLQEPLRAITSFLQLLARRYGDGLDATGRELIEHAVDGADRMHQLIQGLLAFTRAGQRKMQIERIDMNELVAAVLRDLSGIIDEADAQVTVGRLPMVRGDSTAIRQVMQNLVSNALKFRRPGDPVRIAIRAEPATDGERTVFTVWDDGIGLDMEHADRVFEVFQRLHAPDRYPGTGIGLAICKRIVERHGGRIWVESAEGEGATFRFSIPA